MWESGILLGTHEKSQELIIDTSTGAVKAREFRGKGSEEERWNMGEITDTKGPPWQPSPNAAGLELQPRIIAPMPSPERKQGDVEVERSMARGVAVKKMGILRCCRLPGATAGGPLRGGEPCPRAPFTRMQSHSRPIA